MMSSSWSCRECAHFCFKLLWQAHLFEQHWPVWDPSEAGITASTAMGVMLWDQLTSVCAFEKTTTTVAMLMFLLPLAVQIILGLLACLVPCCSAPSSSSTPSPG